MKVFVFVVVILLTTAIKASPLNVDETEGEGETVKSEINVVVQDDSLSTLDILSNEESSSQTETKVVEPEVDLIPEFFATFNDGEKDELTVEETLQKNRAESEETVTNDSDEVVPYEDDEKTMQIEEEAEMSQEEKEKTYGIDIPVCGAHTNLRIPLHLSHLKECRKFYKCYNGRGYLMDCPAGEHWSVHLNRCDYPQLAKCKVDGTYQFKIKKTKPMQASEQVDEEEDKPETGDFEVDPRCEGSDPFKPMHYKHVSDCTKFYKCYMGKAYVIKCPRQQNWAQSLNRCEHPQIARCTIKPTGIKPAQAIEESDSDESSEDYEYYDDAPIIANDPDFKIDDSRCAADDFDIFHPVQFPHPVDCTMFYKCFDHQAFKIQCPGGLHYNEKEEQCDYPEDAQCITGIIGAQAQDNVHIPSIPVCPQNEQVNYQVEGSYTKYFSCISGLAYLMECQNEEIFNPMNKKCEKFQIPQYPMMPDFQFPSGMPQFPQFPGMQFPMNPQMPNSQPQLPNQRPRPQNPEAERPEFPSWMPITKPTVSLPNDVQPNEKPSHNKPSGNNSFDYQSGKQNSRCPSNDNPSKPQHLSHENECKKFYKCFNGRAFLMECPETQEYSDELQRCDYHQFANCDPVELIKKKIQA